MKCVMPSTAIGNKKVREIMYEALCDDYGWEPEVAVVKAIAKLYKIAYRKARGALPSGRIRRGRFGAVVQ